MTREEQIKEAAIEFSKRICSIRPELNVDSFTEGAKWADEHPNGTNIKWQKGEPKEEGAYLVTTIDDMVTRLYFNPDSSEIVSLFKDCVDAWCKLSDIKPYKEDKE